MDEVKSDKTKVVVFRNGWRSVKEHFYHNGKESAIVNSYVYLGKKSIQRYNIVICVR
jgi:hypothetical protein